MTLYDPTASHPIPSLNIFNLVQSFKSQLKPSLLVAMCSGPEMNNNSILKEGWEGVLISSIMGIRASLIEAVYHIMYQFNPLNQQFYGTI